MLSHYVTRTSFFFCSNLTHNFQRFNWQDNFNNIPTGFKVSVKQEDINFSKIYSMIDRHSKNRKMHFRGQRRKAN